MNPQTRATREAKAVLAERGLTEVTGKVFSRRWDDVYPDEIRTVVYMVDPAAREQVITALGTAFPDIVAIYRFDRDDSVATYCALGIHRRDIHREAPDAS